MGSRSKASRAGARESTLSNVSARSAAGVSYLLGVDADEDVGVPRGNFCACSVGGIWNKRDDGFPKLGVSVHFLSILVKE